MKKLLGVLDKFLKFLKTDRNTFFTFILLLITIYCLVDRVTEFLLIVFTGVAYQYWSPFAYAFAYLVLIFGFQFSFSSKYVKSDDDKVSWLIVYCICLYILTMCMLTEWINAAAWVGLLSLPNYGVIGTQFAYLIKPALSSIAISIPLATVRGFFNKMYVDVADTPLVRDSISDYDGISLADNSIGYGEYTDEIHLGNDKEHGKSIVLPEKRRFEATLVVGVSGSGKTTLIFEPWIAQDISKKFFYKQQAKTLAYSALKAGIATLDAPYDNKYINDNFNLYMIKPVPTKINLFKSYFKKLIYAEVGNKIIYRDLGLTYMAPDDETIEKIKNVCDNYGMHYNLIDPEDSHSLGLNPFIFDDPLQTSTCITSILNSFRGTHTEEHYKVTRSNQIIENLSILLKVAYPLINDDKLPNLDDMMKLLNNFTLVEKMCKILENDEELAKRYDQELEFFRRNFYHDSPHLAEMKDLTSIPLAELDSLLKYPGVKSIICNRTHNLNYDDVLANGDITLVSTRRGDLGQNAHRTFGLFFLLLMQYSVLRRPGSESSRIPHFLYIDEFPDFICPQTEEIFTVYRKYKIGTVISAQNLEQLKTHPNEEIGESTIISNCSNKIVFGNNSPQDNEWWSKEIGEEKKWRNNPRTFDASKDAYDPKLQAMKYGPDIRLKPGKIQSMKFKTCAFKIKDIKGKIVNGSVVLDFMDEKYKQKQKVKDYNFTKFTSGISEQDEPNTKVKLVSPYNLRGNKPVSESASDDGDPIKMDEADLKFTKNSDSAVNYNNNSDKKS